MGYAVLQSIPEERSAGKSCAGHDLQSGGKTLAALRHLAERLRTRLYPLKALYLQADFKLSFKAPTGLREGDSYVSDPSKPVPYVPRPVQFFKTGSTSASA